MQKRILIAGGTGLIGKNLTKLLVNKGYGINILTRKVSDSQYLEQSPIQYFTWDPSKGSIDENCFENVIGLINLSGAGIVDKKWTVDYKKELISSRTIPTKFLVNYLNTHDTTCKILLNASGTGYYGADSPIKCNETTPIGNHFISHICKEWEGATQSLNPDKTQLCIVRIGIVQSTKGGALKETLKPMKLGMGSNLGSGKQITSFIHIDDICNLFIHLLENESLTGIFNGVSPYPVSNAQITKAVAKTLDAPLLLPNVPPFVLRIILGQASELVTGSLDCSADKILKSGFTFQYPTIEETIKDVIQNGK